jgi:hypothetical protein
LTLRKPTKARRTLEGDGEHFTYFPKDLEQSGDVTALITTNAIKRQAADFSRSGSGLEIP